jgi:hypothetical protein
MNLEVVIGAAFIAVLIAYAFELAALIALLRSHHSDTWSALGTPNLMAPNDQAHLFAYIFGRKPLVPYPTNAFRARCIRLRCYIVIGLMLFIPLAAILISKKT